MSAEAVDVRLNDYTGRKENHCPGCGVFIERFNSWRPWQEVRFCCYCGQEVRWEKGRVNGNATSEVEVAVCVRE